MKKIILSALLFVMLISMNVDKAEATTCPTGYVLNTQTVFMNGCSVQVDLCVKCDPTSPTNDYDLKIMGFGVLNNCNIGLTTPQILSNLNTICGNPAWLKSRAICSAGIPDCDQYGAGLGVNIATIICWEKTNVNGNMWYTPCSTTGDIYCLERFLSCIDPNTGIRQVTRVQGPSLSGQIGNCTTPESQVPDPSTNGQTSACFYLNTPCNP
ncbi:MAG: hypothetical protein NTW25_14880 [Candidatus Kapabacteria bacterium]|nr:hypothetical protein [Candidatus Kapabacteria bacterium]